LANSFYPLALVFGIIALVGSERKSGMAIAGIVLGSLAILIFITLLSLGAWAIWNLVESFMDYGYGW